MKVAEDVMAVLARAQCDGGKLVLVGQLDRKMYVAVNEVLVAAGGKWNRGQKAHLFEDGAAALASVVLLVGCGADVTQGTVTGKAFVPVRHWTYLDPIYATACSGSGSSFSCHQYIVTYMPVEETDPECWKLSLLDGKNKGSICVSQSEWDGAKVGTYWGAAK